MTTTATIEVKYADPPRDGKKQGTVKTADGAVYGVWPDKLGLLRPGNVYHVEFSERTWNGRTFKTITKAQPQAANANSAGDQAKPASSRDQEFEFVARCLPAMIQACMVGREQKDITDTVRMLRTVYRDSFK